ncbi:MAG: OprO/OprP family phosphate-selective porin, partial [Deferrisomatales bacterium]
KPGRGITVQTEDGRYTAHVGGRLQARYQFTDVDDPDGENESSFSIRRMKFWLQGNIFSPSLKYKWQQNFGGGDSVLEDAYLSYTVADPLTLTLGQFKPPQARQELTSSGSQQFVDRSLANDTFNLGYDIGIEASGSFLEDRIAYALGLFNGNGESEGNRETDHLFAARLDLNPLGAFKRDEVAWGGDQPLVNVGGSYAFIALSDADAERLGTGNEIFDKALDIDGFDGADFVAAFGDELDVTVCTANFHAQWMGASLGAEYYWMNADPKEGDDFDADGYYVQAGYMVLPKRLEVAARYSAIESEDDNASEKFDRSELQLGVNVYLDKHNAKLQADYTRVDDDLNDDRDDSIFRAQAQLIF